MGSKEQKPHINVDYFEDLTGQIDAPASEGMEEIGNRVQRIRESKGLSLTDLSKLTGFDEDLLDRIEKKEVHPQLGTAIKLSKALDSAFGRLVSGVGDKLYSITRREAQRIVSRSTGKAGTQKLYTYKSLAPEVRGRHMEALLVTLEENPRGELSVHDGEEFIYVLEGTVTMQIGEDKFELEPGDSLYYLSTTPHLIAAKQGQAQILAVLYDQ
ncbi:MAG: XRE family transcriptional regulator [Desulfobacterales bacterium]|nr:XRE family transcriptional regulator [Desulfobacterales bacterium]